MVITSTISVHHRLHCVRINALCIFGMHALNAFLSYNIVRSSPHNLKSLVTVGNNVNRCDDTTITRRALYCRERCTFHYEMEVQLSKNDYRNVNQVCRSAANAIVCMIGTHSRCNRDTKMTVLTRPA